MKKFVIIIGIIIVSLTACNKASIPKNEVAQMLHSILDGNTSAQELLMSIDKNIDKESFFIAVHYPENDGSIIHRANQMAYGKLPLDNMGPVIPAELKGKNTILTVKTFVIDKGMSSDEVIQRMKAEKYRPGNLFELMSLYDANPEKFDSFGVVALETQGSRYKPIIVYEDDLLLLAFEWVLDDSEWAQGTKFMGIYQN